MLFTQLITVGLLILSTTGGGLIGYFLRMRQDRRVRNTMVMAGNKAIRAVEWKNKSR